MSDNIIVCSKNNVDYISIRKAMTSGARTVEEVGKITRACVECESCKENLGWILSSVCGCAKASLEDVVNAVKNGANTVEKVGQVTKAGTECGNCKGLIQNVIDLGR